MKEINMHYEIMRESNIDLSRTARYKVKTKNGSEHRPGVQRRAHGGLTQPLRSESRVTETPLQSMVFIEELRSKGGLNTFNGRESRWSSTYTRERANEAFNDYKKLRDITQDKKGLEHGGEIGFICSSFEDASKRVVELVGPVPADSRSYTHLRLGEWGLMKAMGNGTPIKGFITNLTEALPNGKTSRKRISWRFEFDPTKGMHFNVIICPQETPSEESGMSKNKSNMSLNIAFLFSPQNENMSYNSYRSWVENATIQDDLSPSADLTGYLPH